MSALGHIATCAAVLFAATSLGACAGNDASSKQVIAHVGDEAITQTALAHWMTVLKGGRTASDLPAGREQALRKQTLQLLISRQWLLGEAAGRGLSISRAEVSRQIERIEKGDFPGGIAELREFLKSTGQSVSDLELQAKAELASAKLRSSAIASAPAVTKAQIATYYAKHAKSFFVDERRIARYENRKTWAAAAKIKHEVEAGKSLTSAAEREAHEVFTTARVPPGNAYEKAIDSAKPHVVSGPYHIITDYWIYEVVKIIPSYQRTLAQVSGTIRKKLESTRSKRALAQLAQRLKTTWSAKTECRSGYVVQQCRQYNGPRVDEDPLSVQ